MCVLHVSADVIVLADMFEACFCLGRSEEEKVDVEVMRRPENFHSAIMYDHTMYTHTLTHTHVRVQGLHYLS